jgi:hypothetical protein
MTYTNVAAGDPILASTINDLIRYGPAKPMCELQQQAAQTLTSGTSTILTFGTGSEIYDDLNWHDVTTNPSRVTPTIAGRYKVTVRPAIQFNQITTAINAFTSKNGTAFDRTGNVKPSTTSNTAQAGGEIVSIIDCNGTTDYIEGGVQLTTTGATLNTNTGTQGCTMLVELERAP